MPFGITRADCQAVAKTKLADARFLFKNNRFSNSYYLAGYAVEIGLKACIARQIRADTIPDRRLIENTYKHDLELLVRLAGLKAELEERKLKDVDFATNWAVVAQWNPKTRYEPVDKHSAQLLLTAIAGRKSGVITWIKRFW